MDRQIRAGAAIPVVVVDPDTREIQAGAALPVVNAGRGIWLEGSQQIGLGWASYGDTQYTTGARRTILATSREKITNNGLNPLNSFEGQLPLFAEELWDTVNNKYPAIPEFLATVVIVRNSFQAAFTAGANASLDIEFDAGGGIIIWGNSFTFPKGINVVHRLSFTSVFFISPVLLTLPGVEVYLTPSNNTDFFNFSTMINVTYRAS